MPGDVPFWLSYGVLAAVQAATVALARAGALPWTARLHSRWWALIPLASIVATVFAIRAASQTADGLTYLALVATPILAAVALGHAIHGHRRWAAALVAPLFALAWAGHGTIAGQAAAVALTALGCVTLGIALTAVAPLHWLKLGLVAMSAADVALIVANLLQSPSGVLNGAAPVASLPQLQRAAFGTAVMGYGDLFVAGLLGAILVAEGGRQGRIALATAAIAIAFGLLFFVVNELPATVPVALALGVSELRRARRPGRVPRRAAAARAGPAPAAE